MVVAYPVHVEACMQYSMQCSIWLWHALSLVTSPPSPPTLSRPYWRALSVLPLPCASFQAGGGGGDGAERQRKPRDDWLGLDPLTGRGNVGNGVLNGAGGTGQGVSTDTNGTTTNKNKNGIVSAGGARAGSGQGPAVSLLDWTADGATSGAASAGGLLSGGGGGGGGGGASRNQLLQAKVCKMLEDIFRPDPT